MSSIHATHKHHAADATSLPPSLLLLLAAGAGLTVASIYYSQPMLGLLGQSFGTQAGVLGLIPMLTQLGYALGILLLAPLADRYDRRRIILGKLVILILALVLSALAPTMGWLLAGSLAVGLMATVAQDFVPAAAVLAPDAQRGRAVGVAMTGLLLGILLSRVISGFVGEMAGWRSMYLVAAATVGLVTLVALYRLPRFAVTAHMGYIALMRSMGQLWHRHPALRCAVYSQALLALSFSAFWSTLAIMLQDTFGLGSGVAGAFGLAGAAGALAAPLAGRVADRRGSEGVARFGCGLAAVSFAVLGFSGWLPVSGQLALLVVSAIGFDFGVQASMVANQTVVYGLDVSARSRLNAVLVAGMFTGMAAGAGLGSLALAFGGWNGVVALTTISACGGLAVRVWMRARRK